MMGETSTTGVIKEAFGNLIHVKFDQHVQQGEVGFVDLEGLKLKCEVIEILGDIAKIQVFEDTKGICQGTKVTFSGDLLEAELGPGLLSSIVDGLQNPLEKVAEKKGLFLERGIYLSHLDREKKWAFKKVAAVGDIVRRGSYLGKTLENKFTHFIMVPFSMMHDYTVDWVADDGEYTVNEVIAKLKDESGKIYDVTMIQKWPIKRPLIEGKRIPHSRMIDTGMRIVDTQFPIAKGGSFCTPGPFGAGKTVLQHHLSKYSAIDIVIIVACGERAGEVVEVIQTFPHLKDPHTGDSLMMRTMIVCNTSSMPVSAREASVYLGATVAEYYRQMGLEVLLLADSTSRWAQAMREMSGRLEEIPGEEAFPAYLASRIAAFYERSGVIELHDGTKGSLTIGGAVSPAGGNFEEPVTQATLSVVGAFLGLSRQRSDARRYPAIDPLISWTKYKQTAALDLGKKVPDWKERVNYSDEILVNGDEIRRRMEVVGEEGVSIEEFIVYLKAELYDFVYLQQNAFDKEDCYCPLERQINYFVLVSDVLQSKLEYASHEAAREFFQQIQSELKNLNYESFNTPNYEKKYQAIKETLEKQEKESYAHSSS